MLKGRDIPNLHPYTRLGDIGVGGFGRIFLAASPNTGSPVALKLVHRDLAADEELAAQIVRDARIVAEIDHPNVAKVLAAGTLTNGDLFIAVEYIEGQDLSDLLAEAQALDYGRGIAVGIELCHALAAAHSRGVLHLDLKPNNIRLTRNGEDEQVKLLDFGFGAGYRGAALRAGGLPIFGTPEYWSPEQASAQPLDERSDIYGVGIVLYEALTGWPPFSAHSYSDLVAKHLYALPSRLTPPAHCRRIPREVQDIVLRCLAKDPVERFASAEEVGAALAAVAPLESVLEMPVTSPMKGPKFAARTGRRLRRWTLPIGAASLIGIGLLSAVLFAGRSGQAPAVIHRDPIFPASAAASLVDILIGSEPQGAFIYRARGGGLLGKTPVRLSLPRGDVPVDLLVRFPDGQRVPLRFVPEGPVELMVRSPQLGSRARD